MNYKGYECRVVLETYARGGTCIRLVGAGGDYVGEPMATATSWVPGLGSDEVAVKDYSENEGMVDHLIDAGVVSPPHRFVESGHVTLPVCRMATKG